jgi:hypothetical protein
MGEEAHAPLEITMEAELANGSTALQQDVLLEAAVYARFSDADRQRATSIDDQIRECREADLTP